MARIRLESGQTISAPDDLTQEQYAEIAEDAARMVGTKAPREVPREPEIPKGLIARTALEAAKQTAKEIGKTVGKVATLPGRIGKAYGVLAERVSEKEGALEAAKLLTPRGIAQRVAKEYIEPTPSGMRAKEALKPGFEPEVGERAGAFFGQMVGDLPAFSAIGKLVPAIKSAKIAAQIFNSSIQAGAGVGALNALDQLAERGEIDPADVAIATGSGAVFGAGLQAAGMGAHVGISAMRRVLPKVTQTIHNEIREILFYAKKAAGIEQPTGLITRRSRRGYSFIPVEIETALAKGEISIKDAAEASQEVFNRELLISRKTESGSVFDYFEKTPNATPEQAASIMVNSGIPQDQAAERVLAAKGYLDLIRASREAAGKVPVTPEDLTPELPTESQGVTILREEPGIAGEVGILRPEPPAKAPGGVLETQPPQEVVPAPKVTPEAVPESIAPIVEAVKQPDAKFIGFQKEEGQPDLALFNITKPGHPREGSTVTAETLAKEGLEIPKYQQVQPVGPSAKPGKLKIGGFEKSQLRDLIKMVPDVPLETVPPEEIGVRAFPEQMLKFKNAGLVSETGSLTPASKAALMEFKRLTKLSERSFIEDIGIIDVPRVTTKKILGKIEPNRTTLYAGIKEGWITDGKILYRLETEDQPLAEEYSKLAGDSKPPNFESVIEPTKSFTDEIVGIRGIKNVPNLRMAIYLLESKQGEKLAVNAGYFQFLKNRYPNAVVTNRTAADPIAFVEGGEIKAMLMTLRKEAGEIVKIESEKLTGGGRGAFKGGEEGPEIEPEEAKLPEGIREMESESVFETPEPTEKLANMNIVRPMEMPEIVKLSKELLGKYPKIGGLKKNLGYFTYKGERAQIKLKEDIFKDPDLAARVLAHEIGHAVDYLPQKTLKRGNLLGRLLSLRKFLKNTFGAMEANQDLRTELIALSEWWRPFDKTKSSKGYIAYRKGSDELYADAISVLLNSPAHLKERAPKFFKAFFENLDRKPKVKEEYFALQDFLAGKETAILEGRESDLRHGFARAAELSKLKRDQKALRDGRTWEKLRQEHEDVFYPIIKKYQEAVAKGVNIPDDENPQFILDEFNHRRMDDHLLLYRMDNEIRGPARTVGITDEDMGVYLLFNRIINERSEIANPYGHTLATAQKGLDNLLTTLGPEKSKALKEAVDKFHDLVFERVEQAVKVGAYNKETFEKTIVPNKGNYATFAVADYFIEQGFVTAAVKKQKGTLNEVMNPFTATILKTLALNKLIAQQEAKNVTRDLLKTNFAGEILEAERLNPGDMIPLWKKKQDMGILEILEDGHRKAYYVDPLIARSFETQSPGKLMVVSNIFNAVNRGIFHPLLITYNPGFQVFNIQRDFRRTLKGVPNATILNLLMAIFKAIPTAIRRQAGVKDDLIEQMLKDKALDLPALDIYISDEADEFQEILIKHGLLDRPGLKDLPFLQKIKSAQQIVIDKARESKILSPLARLLEFVRFTGGVIESLPKIAGYNLRVKAGEKGKEIGYNVRNYTGTPNFRIKGLSTDITNSIFMFSNIFLQGTKADYRMAVNPKTRSGYWWKTAQIDLLPKFLMFLGASGALGKEIKDHYDRTTEYDKTNYISFPVGSQKGGLFDWKSVYFRMPHDEGGRLISGIFWKMLNAFSGDEKKLAQILDFGAGQLPSLSPAISIADKWAQFLTGKNPYDYFRGRSLIPETEFKAGTWPALKRMIEWTSNQSGLFRFANYDPAGRTTLETFFQATPVLNRIIKISDYGLTEKSMQSGQEKDAIRAEAKLERQPETRQFMRDFYRLQAMKNSGSIGQKQKQTLNQYRAFHTAGLLPVIKNINKAADKGNEKEVERLSELLERKIKNWEKTRSLP